MTTILSMFEGDPRAEALLSGMRDVLYDRGLNMPIPTIIGVLELLKVEIIKDAMED